MERLGRFRYRWRLCLGQDLVSFTRPTRRLGLLALQQRGKSKSGGIAQLVEHRPFKPLVPGSNPGAPTNSKIVVPRRRLERCLINLLGESRHMTLFPDFDRSGARDEH
jgi:hypothetical protein